MPQDQRFVYHQAGASARNRPLSATGIIPLYDENGRLIALGSLNSPQAQTQRHTSSPRMETTSVAPLSQNRYIPPPHKTFFIFSRGNRKKLVITTTPFPQSETDSIAYYIVAPNQSSSSWRAIMAGLTQISILNIPEED